MSGRAAALSELFIQRRRRKTMIFEGARLHRLLKKSFNARFVSGHDSSRADKSFIVVITSRP